MRPSAALYQVSRWRGQGEYRKSGSAAWWNNSRNPVPWGFLGEPRVNVLRLNLALDHLVPRG